jgi:hypothetical protein
MVDYLQKLIANTLHIDENQRKKYQVIGDNAG